MNEIQQRAKRSAQICFVPSNNGGHKRGRRPTPTKHAVQKLALQTRKSSQPHLIIIFRENRARHYISAHNQVKIENGLGRATIRNKVEHGGQAKIVGALLPVTTSVTKAEYTALSTFRIQTRT